MCNPQQACALVQHQPTLLILHKEALSTKQHPPTSSKTGNQSLRIYCSFAQYQLCVKNGFSCSSSTNFGMRIPGRARRVERGESLGSVVGKNVKGGGEEWYDVILYLGIIDIFQDYGVRKRIEHCYKSIQHSSKTISAVHPKIYSSRFQDFVSQIFLPDEDLSN